MNMASTAGQKPVAIKARDGFTSRTLHEPPVEPRSGKSALAVERLHGKDDDPSLKGSFPSPLVVRCRTHSSGESCVAGRGFVERVSSSMDAEGDSLQGLSSHAAERGGASAESAAAAAGSQAFPRTVRWSPLTSILDCLANSFASAPDPARLGLVQASGRSSTSRYGSAASSSTFVYPFDLQLTEAAVTCIVFYPGTVCDPLIRRHAGVP